MKKIISVIFASLISIHTFCQMLPSGSAYSADDTSIAEEQLDMPVIYIDTLGNKIDTKKEYTTSTVKILDKNGVLDTPETSVQIRLRGNATLNCDKKSYKFKFDQKKNPLSLGEGPGKSWNLLANYFDSSLLRNMTAYHLGDMFTNMPYSVNSRSVEVFVNGSYQGVYLFCENINVNKSRLPIAEEPELVEENGYLVELTRSHSFDCFTIDSTQYTIKSKLSDDSYVKMLQKDYISQYMEQSFDALRKGNKEQIEELIDVPSLVDNFIANEICKNPDIGWGSFYICKDAGSKLMFAPMWDYDSAFGNFAIIYGFDSPYGINEYDITNNNANSNQWYYYALQNDWFREAVAVRWREMSEQINTLPDFVKEEAQKNLRSYKRNFDMWEPIKEYYYETNDISKLTEYQEHADYLSEWIGKRIKWLDGYFNSDDFMNGIFFDENCKPADVENAFAVTWFTFYDLPDFIDYESLSFSIEASSFNKGFFRRFLLRSGHKYKLSFDVSGASTAELKFIIKASEQYSDWNIEDTVDVTEEKKHFEREFSAEYTDYANSLELSISGSGTVNVEHLSLTEVENSGSAIKGDVNDDGKFNISDIVIFQKWLLGATNTELANWKAADLCEDDKLDIFDLCIMRRMLIEL